jgi:transcriptional regulator with XRE-family HTH domain
MGSDLRNSSTEASSGRWSGRLTPGRIEEVAEFLIAGRTRAEIARALDVSPRTVSRWKKDSAVLVEIERLRNRTSEDRAVDALEQLLETGSERMVLGAAQTLLRRSERAPKEPAPAGNVVIVDNRDKSLPDGDPHNDPNWRAEAYNALGYVIHADGEPARAREYYRIALEAATEIGLVEAQLHALLGIAAAEAKVGDSSVGARLFGWMKELASRLGTAYEEQDEALKQKTLASLETALGPERLASDLAAGATLPLEDAIDLALGRRDPATSDSGER